MHALQAIVERRRHYSGFPNVIAGTLLLLFPQ
jgi:hypothetical protein